MLLSCTYIELCMYLGSVEAVIQLLSAGPRATLAFPRVSSPNLLHAFKIQYAQAISTNQFLNVASILCALKINESNDYESGIYLLDSSVSYNTRGILSNNKTSLLQTRNGRWCP